MRLRARSARDFKLAVRQENPHYGNGVLPEELETVVAALERAGVTSFHVALANHSSLGTPYRPPRTPALGRRDASCPTATWSVNIPVCPSAGRGTDAVSDFVEEQLASGRIDCAAMSRQLIADPDWPKKVISIEREIRRCVPLQQKCLGGMMRHEGVHCIYEGRKQK